MDKYTFDDNPQAIFNPASDFETSTGFSSTLGACLLQDVTNNAINEITATEHIVFFIILKLVYDVIYFSSLTTALFFIVRASLSCSITQCIF